MGLSVPLEESVGLVPLFSCPAGRAVPNIAYIDDLITLTAATLPLIAGIPRILTAQFLNIPST